MKLESSKEHKRKGINLVELNLPLLMQFLSPSHILLLLPNYCLLSSIIQLVIPYAS